MLSSPLTVHSTETRLGIPWTVVQGLPAIAPHFRTAIQQSMAAQTGTLGFAWLILPPKGDVLVPDPDP